MGSNSCTAAIPSDLFEQIRQFGGLIHHPPSERPKKLDPTRKPRCKWSRCRFGKHAEVFFGKRFEGWKKHAWGVDRMHFIRRQCYINLRFYTWYFNYCIKHLVKVKFIHLHLLSNFQPQNTIPSPVTGVVASCGLGLHLLLAAAVRQYLGWLGAAVWFPDSETNI